MPTTVVHCKRQPYDVYIGRPSKWGNPFILSGDAKGTGEQAVALRAAAVKKYESWLRDVPALMAALPELRGKVLGCWCAPLPCHGDVLARLADEVQQ